MLEVDCIKDEPSELDVKNEAPFEFPNESSQFLNTESSNYYSQMSEVSLPSMSSLPDSEKEAHNQRLIKEVRITLLLLSLLKSFQ